MDLQRLREPLGVDDIEFRVQSINKGNFVTILAYKNARVDMKRLDDVVGPMNWKREHTRDNQNCIVSIWDEAKKQWVSKEDTGTESFTEKEKGLASDSFKRACFNWGIGRELYDYPEIEFLLEDEEVWVKNDKRRLSYKCNLKDWVWHTKFNEAKEIVEFGCRDEEGRVRFWWTKQDGRKVSRPKIAKERKKLDEIDPQEVEDYFNGM